MDPRDTEVWEPEPTVVTPGADSAPPSDAIVLFDGSEVSAWRHLDGRAVEWRIESGAVIVVAGTGDIETTRAFADVQLHIEWRAPQQVTGGGQSRGNSGVFLQKRYEIQVLDSYENRTYANGQAGSVYKQYAPLVNASRRPGEWQSYDIVFAAPRFSASGKLETSAFVTLFHNGVLVQNHVGLLGATRYRGTPEYQAHPAHEPLMLQDHGDPVSFRNIWLRELGGAGSRDISTRKKA